MTPEEIQYLADLKRRYVQEMIEFKEDERLDLEDEYRQEMWEYRHD